MDGLSFTTTQNAGAAPNHIFTYAVGVSDNVDYVRKSQRCGCPCTDFGAENINKAVLGGLAIGAEN